ncbi:MAG: ABC transporter permease subunit [Planctomycetota bacterium]|nr:ABC transporter permease subunit [Planctomycetota bacterium]
MNWTNVKLIWQREVRDQLRDRRTIFTIAVLPVLLYPLLGMSFLQITQFMKEHPTSVWVIGSSDLPEEPQLLAEHDFQVEFCPAEENRLLKLTVAATGPVQDQPDELRDLAQRQIQDGTYDAVLYFPPGFADGVSQYRADVSSGTTPASASSQDAPLPVPQPVIYVNLANDRSCIAYDRLERVLNRWRKAIVRQNLISRHVPEDATDPFQVNSTDLSEEVHRRAAIWSRLLPFVVLIWALTGAFYPAIDLCAGEKERGTLETLLSSPADRREIVWGKLLTVMSFSVATALLNLLSMGVSATFIVRQIAQLPDLGGRFSLGPPPLSAVGWLLLAVLPISALFSALTLAIAAFARSSKEGQYYLMPLLLITFPLMTLPMLPAVALDLGTSLIPVTGMLLWLRVLIEGEYVEAVRFALPVIGITTVCCWAALRWAVRQFENESVLFRESERFGLGIWLRHLVRDSDATPSAAQAISCGVLLLLATFFASLRAAIPTTWIDFARIVLVTQIGLIATPVLLMTLVLTRSPRRTLLLVLPRWSAVPAAFLLAVTLNPLAAKMVEFISTTYPLSEDVRRSLESMVTMLGEAPPIYVVLLIGLTPAICEELAFRGFILSGLRQMGSKWAAIVISSLFFGLTHGLLQQSMAATVVGVVIGYVVVQSGSLVPGMVFHCTHNSLSVLTGRVTPAVLDAHPWLNWIFCPAGPEAAGYAYHWAWLVPGAAVGAGILLWFRQLPRGAGTGS